jgi:Recombinase
MIVIARSVTVASAGSLEQRAASRAADLAPVIAELQASGAATLQAIADGLNARGIPAARGGRWRPTQVARAMSARR